MRRRAAEPTPRLVALVLVGLLLAAAAAGWTVRSAPTSFGDVEVAPDQAPLTPRWRAPSDTVEAVADVVTEPLPARPAVVVLAPLGTAKCGALVLLHRPSFSPAATLADELWPAFVAARALPFEAMLETVTDRLARLGWRGLWRGEWRHGETVQPPDLAEEPPGSAWLALSPQAVGHAVVGAARLCAVAPGELVTNGHDELWAWAEGAFPGPHRVVDGLVPAGDLRVLGVDRAASRLTYYRPLTVAPLARAVAGCAPARAVRPSGAPWPLPSPALVGDVEVLGMPWPCPPPH